MIAPLAWATLTVCAIATLCRIPSALRGENRSLFFLLLLMTLAVFLGMRAPYEQVDHLLGGMNIAHIVLRFIVFAFILILGFRVARGFGATDALRLITGPIGMAVLAFCSFVILVVFPMMDTAGSATRLVGISDRSTRDAALVQIYDAAGRLYPAYVTLALLPAMVRALASRLPVLVRGGAALLALGSIAITLALLLPLYPPGLVFLKDIPNYTAVLCLVLGLTLIWLGSITAKRAAGKKPVLLETSSNIIHKNIRS